MGLFDNLFLDQNTAVTINDGIDHSKDIVRDIVEPQKGESSSAIQVESSIPVDGNLAGLFDSDTREDASAEATLHPEPPKDIALEIGLGSTPSTSDSLQNFDIGGDVYFDIGGDIGSSSLTNTEGQAPLGDTPDTISISTLPTPVLSLDTALPPEIMVLSEVPNESSLPTIEIPSEGVNTSSDNALFSLLNEEANSSHIGEDIGALESVAPPVDSIVTNGLIPSASSSIFDGLLGVPDNTPVVSDGVVPQVSVLSERLPLPALASLSSYEISSSPVSALTSLTGSPKLKEKLSQFITELESMELEDQSEKTHKRQQIEMYRTRIREIKAEYDMRIRALELEERELEKQIGEMDEEKSRIRNVLTTFQKELQTGGAL